MLIVGIHLAIGPTDQHTGNTERFTPLYTRTRNAVYTRFWSDVYSAADTPHAFPDPPHMSSGLPIPR